MFWGRTAQDTDVLGYGTTVSLQGSKRPLPVWMSPKLNGAAITCCLLGPVSMFALVSGVSTSTLRYDHATLCWAIVCLAALTVLICCYLTLKVLYLRFVGRIRQDATWYVLLSLTLIAAFAGGLNFGCFNYWSFIRPAKDTELLSSYPNVDTATSSGRQYMDAGRIKFVEGTKLDLRLSTGFKNLDRYCVAPISSGNSTLQPVYDFWAVGMNCCDGKPGNYNCGEYLNAHARSGLRLLREDLRPFYQLAVKQAEATFGIRSEHPLFFYWMQDPVAEIDRYWSDSVFYYLSGVGVFFCFQLSAVIFTLVVRLKTTP